MSDEFSFKKNHKNVEKKILRQDVIRLLNI